jgi:hypothetical protein
MSLPLSRARRLRHSVNQKVLYALDLIDDPRRRRAEDTDRKL